MKEVTIKWSEYPETKPEVKGVYMVTVEGLSEPLFLSYSEFSWNADGVIAWAKKPEIYRKEDN